MVGVEEETYTELRLIRLHLVFHHPATEFPVHRTPSTYPVVGSRRQLDWQKTFNLAEYAAENHNSTIHNPKRTTTQLHTMPSPPSPPEKGDGRGSGTEDKVDGPFARLVNSMFGNEHIDVEGEIHKKLNEQEEYRKRRPGMMLRQDLEQLFGKSPFSSFPPLETSSSHYSMRSSRRSSSNNALCSSYSIQQDNHGVQVAVDIPSDVNGEDLKVEVLKSIPSCVVQWSGNNSAKNQRFSERVRLGSRVDCDRLVASLSQSENVLRLSAPSKQAMRQQDTKPRSVPITEHED